MSTFAPQSPFRQGTSERYVSIGTRHEDVHGRVFYYAYAATAVGRGKVARAASDVDNHINLSFASSPAVGDRKVAVTLGATAATEDQYKDGTLNVQDGTGEGRLFFIEGHSAASASASLDVYLTESIDITMATAETNVDLNYNLYDELLPPSDAGQAYLPVGVPGMVGGLGAAEHGYVQTWGAAAVWRDEADASIGADFTWGAGTGTGQIEDADAVTETRFGKFGTTPGVATEYQVAYLHISR